MTQTLGTNDNNDLYLGSDGNLVMLSGIQAVLAACETASKAQLGEMVLATTSGIPNFETVWVGSPNYSIWQSYLRETLQNVQGVIEVIDLKISPRDGVLSYTATIRTQFGIAEINA